MKKILVLSLALLAVTGVQSKSIKDRLTSVKSYPKDMYAKRKLNQEKKKIKAKIDKYTTKLPKIRATAHHIVDQTLTLKELKAVNYSSQALADRAISQAFKKAGQEAAKAASSGAKNAL